MGSVCSKSGVLCDCGGALETSQDCCFVDLGVNLFYLLERCCALFCIIASERKNPNRKWTYERRRNYDMKDINIYYQISAFL